MLNPFPNRLATIATVSYTHLDVYKRQDLYVAAYPLRERALETVPHRYGEGYRTEYRQHHEKDCLLYTSIDEYYSEGKAQNICVFGSEYYKKADTLILSARIGGEICLLYTSRCV